MSRIPIVLVRERGRFYIWIAYSPHSHSKLNPRFVAVIGGWLTLNGGELKTPRLMFRKSRSNPVILGRYSGRGMRKHFGYNICALSIRKQVDDCNGASSHC